MCVIHRMINLAKRTLILLSSITVALCHLLDDSIVIPQFGDAVRDHRAALSWHVYGSSKARVTRQGILSSAGHAVCG